VNILNNQPQTADSNWSSSLGVGRGEKTCHRKNPACYEMLRETADLDKFFRTIQGKENDMRNVRTV
jgi:hypothetical protein